MRDVKRENSLPMLGGWSVRASRGTLELRAPMIVADFKAPLLIAGTTTTSGRHTGGSPLRLRSSGPFSCGQLGGPG